MKITDATTNDIPSIMEIFKQNPTYDLSLFHNTIKDSTITLHDELIAYGALKIFGEAVLLLDHTRPKRTQLNAFMLLLEQAVMKAKELQIHDLHVFTEIPEFAELLKNKFGFEKINGEALILKVNNGYNG